jgi:hypothetical protein
MDLCGKSLREKNGDAHKGIQNITIRIVIRIVTCLKYHDTYCDKNSVLLHSYYQMMVFEKVVKSFLSKV